MTAGRGGEGVGLDVWEPWTCGCLLCLSGF